MTLSKDAIILGFAQLRDPRHSMTFGGEGTEYELHPRTRAALNELLEAGYAEPTQPEDQVPGREAYRGTDKDPFIGKLVQEAGIDPFNMGGDDDWPLFTRIGAAAPEAKP